MDIIYHITNDGRGIYIMQTSTGKLEAIPYWRADIKCKTGSAKRVNVSWEEFYQSIWDVYGAEACNYNWKQRHKLGEQLIENLSDKGQY